MFGRKKIKKTTDTYDKEALAPVIRCSICTGEQVAGFRDKATGKFQEITVIRTPADLEDFLKSYGIKREDLKKEY